jgi:hypothetical protein
MTNIYRPHKDEIEYEKIKHGPKRPRGQGKSCYISYANNKEFVIQLPRMRAPYGVSEPLLNDGEEKQKNDGKYTLDLSLNEDPQYDKKGHVKKVSEFFKKFDELNVKYISDCSNDWWEEHLTTSEVAKFNYGSPVKKSKKKNNDGKLYPNTLRLKLPFYKGNPQFKVFDANTGEEIKFTETTENGQPEIKWETWSPPG